MSQGKEKNLILLKLHADFLRDLWLRGAAKTHSALVAVQGFIQEKFSTVVYPGKSSYSQFKYLNLAISINLSIIYIYEGTYIFFKFFFTCSVEWSQVTSQKQRKAHGQRKRKGFTLHFMHIQL